MLNQSPRLSEDYLNRRRRQLIELRTRLRHTIDSAELEEKELQLRNTAVAESREYEEEAQRLDQLERDDNLVGGIIVRLARVRRALEKIDDGTYGLSDESGEPIAEERLEAMPDAVNTLAEQDRIEALERLG